MNILVTGSNGQLGNEIQQLVIEKNFSHHFFFTDVKELDITDRQAIDNFVTENDIQLIINCAAYTAVDKAEEHVDLCRLLNHIAPGYLAEIMHRHAGKLIHISTDYVFDGTAYLPLKENTPPHPKSVYGQTKLDGEQAILNNCPQSIIIRTAWLYSSFGNNFVKTMLKLGNERKQLNVVADQIGTPTYAADLAKTILTIVHTTFIPGIYHFSNEGVCSWYDFTKAIFEIANINSCEVHPIHTDEYPTLAERPHYSVLDKSLIKNTFHLSIPWWKDSLKKCINQLNSHI